MQKHIYTHQKDKETVKLIRRKIGMTQAEIAHALGVSIRAIQSYEQGWRDTPTHIMVQLLVLVAAYRASTTKRPACWDVRGCSTEGQKKCPCHHTDGRLCWLVSGRVYAGKSQDICHDLSACMDCSVIQQLLS